MRFGLAPPNYAKWFDGAAAREVSKSAEELGFDSLWFGDHVAIPKAAVDVFGNAYLDALTLIGYVAAATSRIRLGTNVLVVPYRDPIERGDHRGALDGVWSRADLYTSDARDVLGVDNRQSAANLATATQLVQTIPAVVDAPPGILLAPGFAYPAKDLRNISDLLGNRPQTIPETIH